MTFAKFVKPEVYPVIFATGCGIVTLGYFGYRAMFLNPDIALRKSTRQNAYRHTVEDGTRFANYTIRNFKDSNVTVGPLSYVRPKEFQHKQQ